MKDSTPADLRAEGGIQSLSRAFALLDVIAQHPEGIGLSDLCRAVGLHSSTGWHLVKTMTALGYLRQAADSKRYVIGSRIFHLAAAARGEVQLASIAEPVVRHLAAASGNGAAFGLAFDDEMVILSKAGGEGLENAWKLRGSRAVNHCTAMGKLILAEMSPDRLEQYLAGREIQPFTPATITDRARLIEEASRARASGLAFEDGEFRADVRSVAAPVRDFTHQVVGALTLIGPASSLSLQALHERSLLVRNAAQALSTQLGYQPSRGQEPDAAYPSRPVRIVVPFAPGGSMDTVARLISPALSFSLRQPVLVENRPGAGGTLAALAVAKSPPDGHTLLLTSSWLAAAPALYRELPFDPVRDFVAVAQLLASEYWLAVPPTFPAYTVDEVVALARRSDSPQLRYGHTGLGSPSHLAMERFKAATGIDAAPATFDGMAPLVDALVVAQLDVAMVTIASSHVHASRGHIRPLAVAAAKRSAAFPQLPTIAEAGLTGFEASGWNSMFVAAQTPPRIVQRLRAEAIKALEPPNVRSRLPALGLTVVGSTSAELAAMFKADVARFARAVRGTKLRPQNWRGE